MSVRLALPRHALRPSAPAHRALLNQTAPLSRRSFLTFPGTDTQTLTATRTLPYAREPLYELIADVDSYSRFVPYCSISRVTQWSPPDAQGRRWPSVADLHVGWGGFNEVFTSQLRCVPGESVEAVSGDDATASSAVFKSLVTRWTVRPVTSNRPSSSPATEVHLSIKYQFVNPLYAAVSAAVSDKVAGLMIEAFEKRAQEKLGAPARL
ncbi:dehydrase and lipid transport-domain-containing protein [Stachybotrys elegans]|uniref:Dehydrase and lipid transport-domain-containing protein n=1 Tax=Stachybotrys elegans TaxID=80388 RepID=A0A8K0SRY5_9HYPO|nr:dehydrase and lipid transport-domain-containing protein [Stachybotrys elegans]